MVRRHWGSGFSKRRWWRQHSLRLLCNYSSLSLASPAHVTECTGGRTGGHGSLSLLLPMGSCGLSLVGLGQARLGHTVAEVCSWHFPLQIFS